ncbi:PREDICTED: uncharacterized protein LOC106102772 [Papilio polytes]|uniref:uncharacterized protein LOC106102772 n=1 Tax=Papilio polytes TaxID=76194 RepID=UPI0006763195|nr:PREDICTED: uncharacterized protein LOC106102772 [Papilio polytes]
MYVPYAPHVADLLQVLQQAFTAAAKALGHDIEKVSWFSWSVLREAWSPWAQPGAPPSLLPILAEDSQAHTDMLQRFTETLTLVMEDCPGSSEYVVREAWQWAVHTYLSAGAATQCCRVALSALLAALDRLPWHTTQWMHAACMPLAMQMSRSSDRELVSWCSARWRGACAASWLRGVHHAHLAPHLVALLSLFCSPHLQLDAQVMEEATLLPWQRLPETALDAAFEQFFVDFHNPAFPYHETLQFRLLLCASQLIIVDESAACPSAQSRRARSVSQCVRAAAVPALAHHARAHTDTMLRVLTDLASHIETSEIEELLSRALVIMCIEPAAAAALPVWQQWLVGCGTALRLAAASAAATLTALEYFVPLVDTIAKTHMTLSEDGEWSAVRSRLRACAWGASAACAAGARRAWHAAYALLQDTPDTPHTPHTDLLRALADYNITPYVSSIHYSDIILF